ncbi:LuxR family transcriptional regulator [Bifidobacterium animalis subsp. animalis MCC 1489]|uniref:Response regulator of two-component system n=1 Tax=Bifidobacterium animalis subsp. animalis IM386 TaxID=1402194 RepID=A0AAV2W2T3_9BIFI|nr:response regulator transcription factor [Bifidobacterium animalis]AFI63320.1 response regulator of two-component system [Bifidobacterium animalis subsp. animalis ATCC 25527]AYN23950.1 response regulator of two-component system [Bifidobacterium animalis subsp. animalis]KFI44649.1 response regulator of two-component system [Bifidobacterium animalis subsp. animalis]KOA62946.1 LuxR family transcriptional regulator [Bifidobacterium animalis subsp. animalis MCC 1489]CDI66841.1 Response regulator 
MKVAIVDDDPIVCSSIGTILTATGTAEVVWTAHDGGAAVVAYARQKPDVLLIDVQMPGTDGLEASERILAEHPDARILVLTTFADSEYIRRAIELGTKGYLIKQDVASVIPAVQAVMAGQVVLGADVLRNLPMHDAFGNVEGPKASPLPEDSRFAHLTDREHDIVELVAEGLDNREIAAKLFLSGGTVRNRISDILAKTNISNRTKLAIEWLTSHDPHIHDHHIDVR